MSPTGPSAGVPSPAELQPTLCKVTERLARELASPGAEAPDWSREEWTVARAVAAMHGISPLLSRSLPWRGPHAWVDFLDAQREHTRARHSRISELLESIDQKAQHVGLSLTALKGAALHGLSLYEPGDRPMADLDLLVRPADLDGATALVSGMGFRLTEQSWKERVFTLAEDGVAAEFGEHTANSLKIEVHQRICEKLPLRITDMSECIFPRVPHPGVNGYPSNGSLMSHLLLHGAGSMAFQSLRILQVHDIGLLATRLSATDWREVVEAQTPNRRWWAYPPLEMASRYYRSIPSRVLAALRRACPYVLRQSASNRTLTQVSYSYLWVKAFPGIEWSQSPLEMLQYGWSRVRPNKAHLASRKRTAANQAWAKYGDWSSRSQLTRVLRWMSSRQTRPATMHVIAAAFCDR